MQQEKRKLGWKVFAAVLSLTVLAGAMAGCTQKPADSGKDSSSASTAGQDSSADSSSAQGTPSDKTSKIVYIAPVNGPVDKDNQTQQFLNTLAPGLEVETVGLDIGDYWELLNPRLAGGEIPDIFWCHNSSMFQNYVEQGVLCSLDVPAIKANCPNFVAASEEYGLEVWKVPMIDGKIYGMPAMDEAQTRPFTNAWRGDWLKAVGIEKIPETVEEYGDALRKFTFEDPDGNGQNDTYGTTLRGKDAVPNLFTSLFATYGVFPGMWNKGEDGTLRYGITDPRAKDALKVLSGWFKEGLIDPEFTAVDGSIRTEKWANSKIGMLSDSTFYEVNPGSAAHDNLVALSPDAEITRGPAPKGPNGDYGYMNWSKFTNLLAFGSPAGSEEGRLDKILQLVEKLTTDADTHIRARFGEEGTMWKRDEEQAIVKIAPYNDPNNCGEAGTNFFGQGAMPTIPAVRNATVSVNEPEQYKYADKGTMVNGENYFSYLSKFTDAAAETAYKTEADAFYQKNLIDFITGARPLDEYDAFVEEWNQIGGEAYTKAYNEAQSKISGEMDAAKKLFE